MCSPPPKRGIRKEGSCHKITENHFEATQNHLFGSPSSDPPVGDSEGCVWFCCRDQAEAAFRWSSGGRHVCGSPCVHDIKIQRVPVCPSVTMIYSDTKLAACHSRGGGDTPQRSIPFPRVWKRVWDRVRNRVRNRVWNAMACR